MSLFTKKFLAFLSLIYWFNYKINTVGLPLLPMTEWLVPDELPLKITTKAKQKKAAGHRKTSERHQRSWVSLALDEEKPFWTKTFLKTLTVLRLWDYVRRKWLLGEQIFSRSFHLKCSREREKRCVKDTNEGALMKFLASLRNSQRIQPASENQPQQSQLTSRGHLLNWPLKHRISSRQKAAYRYPEIPTIFYFNTVQY